MSIKNTLLGVVSSAREWLASADQMGVILAVILIVIVFLARNPIARFLIVFLNKLMMRLSGGMSEKTQKELTKTTSILVVTLSFFVAVEAFSLPDMADGFLRRLIASIAILSVFAGWYNLCGPFVALLSGDIDWDVKMETAWMERVARFGVVLFGITAILTVWEVDITGALTGVGVLGAGMAIATQDLIRNLVAGMNNVNEKRFSLGDVVEIEGVFVGTVEKIDLRSTLLRGFDQIPRYVPNSELSNAVVLNYSQRRNRRVKLSIPLVKSSTKAQIKDFCDGLRTHLMESGDFELSEDAPKYVHVEELSESAVLVLFYAWTTNPDYADSLRVGEELTLKIMELVDKCETALAYPTHSLNFSGQPPEMR